MKGDEIVRACERYSNETVIVKIHVTKYKNMRKFMVEFLGKSESRGNKTGRVNSICITKSINLLWFCMHGVGLRNCDADIFKLTARAQSTYREVYDLYHLFKLKNYDVNIILLSFIL